MWTPHWLSQRLPARILGALGSFCRFAFAGIKAIFTCLESTFKFIALSIPVLIFVFVLVYSYPKVSRDALIIDSFSVPKRFEEAGLTPDVVANRIGNAMQEINADAHAQIEKNEVTWAHDEGSIPDVEVPGTKLGLKTFVEMARALPGAHKAKHVVGDIVALQTGGPTSVISQVTVTIYLKDHQGSQVIRFPARSSDIDLLTWEIAERIWGQVKPYVLASHLNERRNPEEALKLARQIIADEPPENSQVAAAYALIGKILSDQRKYDEAFANVSKSIDLNPKSPFPYIVWGNALASQGNDYAYRRNYPAADKNFEEAIDRYKKAIEINPRSPVPYNNWGNTLRYRKKYQEGIAKYQQAIKLDPKFAPAYNDWGNALASEGNDLADKGDAPEARKKYDEAIEQYQRACDIDPRFTNHKWWGKVLFFEKRYDEAIAQYQKAIGLEPKAVNGYIYWGDTLAAQQKYDEAIEKYKEATRVDPNNADAYEGWGNALLGQRKRKAAEEKFAKARERD